MLLLVMFKRKFSCLRCNIKKLYDASYIIIYTFIVVFSAYTYNLHYDEVLRFSVC